MNAMFETHPRVGWQYSHTPTLAAIAPSDRKFIFGVCIYVGVGGKEPVTRFVLNTTEI